MSKKHYKHLTYEQRAYISQSIKDGHRKEDIATALGCHISTVYNEIKRGSINGEYSPEYAQKRCDGALRQKGVEPMLSVNKDLANKISHLITAENLSLDGVIQRLGDSAIPCPAKTTLYAAIDKGLIPNVTKDILRKRSIVKYQDGKIQIPPSVKDELSIKDGDTFALKILGGNIVLIKQNKDSEK